MSTHVPGFQSFLRFFASFCIGQISHQQPGSAVGCTHVGAGPQWSPGIEFCLTPGALLSLSGRCGPQEQVDNG